MKLYSWVRVFFYALTPLYVVSGKCWHVHTGHSCTTIGSKIKEESGAKASVPSVSAILRVQTPDTKMILYRQDKRKDTVLSIRFIV